LISLDFLNFGARRSKALVASAEAALVIVLAVQAARLVWILAAPAGPVGSAAPAAAAPRGGADLAILERFDPFFRLAAAAPAAPAAAGDEAGLRLFGVRTDGAGGGSAIIRASDGREASFLVGEEVEPGLVLREVAADHVILARGGARQRLGFPQIASSFATPAAAPGPVLPVQAAAADAPGAVPAQQLLAAAAMSPRMKDGRPDGYRVTPRGGAGAGVLAQAGLQSGDVILAIDGEAFSAERLEELPGQLAKSEWVDLRIERGGQTLTTRVRIAQR